MVSSVAGIVTGEEKSELDKWVLRSKVIDNPRIRLFCLPYFAGGASVYNSWSDIYRTELRCVPFNTLDGRSVWVKNHMTIIWIWSKPLQM